MLLMPSSSKIGSLLPEDLFAKILFTSISLTLQSEEMIWRGIMFPNISSSGTWWKFSQSVISRGKIDIVNSQYGVHSYPSADGTKPFQNRGRIWGRTMEINGIKGITAICTNCSNMDLLSKITIFFCINVQPGVTKAVLPSAERSDGPSVKWDLSHCQHLCNSWQST